MQIQRELKPMDYTEQFSDLPEGSFRVSPSQVDEFTTKKHEWYRSQVLKETTFEGNTSTHLGTCIHRVAEQWLKQGTINDEEIFEYIKSIDDPMIDKEYILEQYPPMKASIIDYLKQNPFITESELSIVTKLKEGYYIGGTLDALEGDNCIIDFKTVDSHTPNVKIPRGYKWQLLTYAWILRELRGKPIEKIKIVWITHQDINRVSEKTGKPLKDYPSRYIEIEEEVTAEDMNFIDSYLRLIVDSVEYAKKHPEAVYIVFADYRLKEDSF